MRGCLSPTMKISDNWISAGPKREEEQTPREDPRGLARKICPSDRPVYPAHSRTDLLQSGKVEGSLLPPSRAAVVELASSATRGVVYADCESEVKMDEGDVIGLALLCRRS